MEEHFHSDDDESEGGVLHPGSISGGWNTQTSKMRQTVGFLACVASASAFLAGPAALPGTARYNGAVNARSGIGLRAARPAVVLRKNNAAALSMQTATGVDTAALAKAANEARGLAMDSIAAAHSGHLGLPLGCAEVILPAHFCSRFSLSCIRLVPTCLLERRPGSGGVPGTRSDCSAPQLAARNNLCIRGKDANGVLRPRVGLSSHCEGLHRAPWRLGHLEPPGALLHWCRCRYPFTRVGQILQ